MTENVEAVAGVVQFPIGGLSPSLLRFRFPVVECSGGFTPSSSTDP